MLLAVLPAVLAAACGGTSKTTDPATTTTKQSTVPSAQSNQYHVGAHCKPSLAFAYSTRGLTCVNGTLRHKAQHGAPATVHHKSQTTSTAPQGY